MRRPRCRTTFRRGLRSLTVAAPARTRDGMPPRSYVRFVLMAPHAAAAGPWIRYVEETSGASPDALLRTVHPRAAHPGAARPAHTRGRQHRHPHRDDQQPVHLA